MNGHRNELFTRMHEASSRAQAAVEDVAKSMERVVEDNSFSKLADLVDLYAQIQTGTA